jgi:hypothetical protein
MAITISGSGITSANIADGTIVNADVNDVAASKLTGALPAISGASLTSLPYDTLAGEVRTTGIGNIDFGTAWATLSTTYYKWVLPSAGTYILMASVRARVWNVNGFAKVRLHNYTTNTYPSNDMMLIESQVGPQKLNAQVCPTWQITVTGANTIHLQGIRSGSVGSGIQSDSNGYNSMIWVKT